MEWDQTDYRVNRFRISISILRGRTLVVACAARYVHGENASFRWWKINLRSGKKRNPSFFASCQNESDSDCNNNNNMTRGIFGSAVKGAIPQTWQARARSIRVIGVLRNFRTRRTNGYRAEYKTPAVGQSVKNKKTPQYCYIISKAATSFDGGKLANSIFTAIIIFFVFFFFYY